MKKILKKGLAFLMALSMLPGPVFAADEAAAVAVQVEAASGTMNLTQTGPTDWIHLTGSSESVQIVHKAIPSMEATGYEELDYMNASNSNGHTIGQISDQVWRYQTFTPSVTGPLLEV